MTFTWQAGRQLATLQKGTTGISYTYGSDGTRLTKTVNGVKTSYTWDGAQLVSQTTTGGDTLYFIYHGDSRVAVEYKGNTYYYIYNLQGDVVGLVNSSGNTVVSYTYDAWGNPESISGSMASTLGAANPFRYRSYYFDTESGLYYLMSRYYDPVVGRFINEDALLGGKGDILAYNLFAYCSNNPITRCDCFGLIWELNGEVYKYDGSMADFHRAERGEPPLAYEKALNALSNQNTISTDPSENCPSVSPYGGVQIGKGWEYMIHQRNDDARTKRHIHIRKNGEEYAQNEDGTPHDGSKGSPPKWLKKELKKKGIWDWDGNLAKQDKGIELPTDLGNDPFYRFFFVPAPNGPFTVPSPAPAPAPNPFYSPVPVF